MRDQLEANMFQLQGDGSEVSFSATSIDGQPVLTLRRGGAEQSFSGEEVLIEPSPLGTLATATVESVPDRYVRTLTLLVPSVNLRGGEPVRLSTLAIFTTNRTSIGGTHLVDGPLQRYDVIHLEGEATFVFP